MNALLYNRDYEVLRDKFKTQEVATENMKPRSLK